MYTPRRMDESRGPLKTLQQIAVPLHGNWISLELTQTSWQKWRISSEYSNWNTGLFGNLQRPGYYPLVGSYVKQSDSTFAI